MGSYESSMRAYLARSDFKPQPRGLKGSGLEAFWGVLRLGALREQGPLHPKPQTPYYTPNPKPENPKPETLKPP